MYHQGNGDTNNNAVTILIPQHVSVPPPSVNACLLLVLQCHRSGVMWRAMAPMLLEAPEPISQRLLQLIWDSSPCRSNTARKSLPSSSSRDGNTNEDGGDEQQQQQQQQDPPFPGFRHRRLQFEMPAGDIKIPPNTIVYLKAPVVVHPDPIFTAVVLQVEHSMLKLQTLTAWYATLGGGYFLCKRLSHSLILARQQRLVALHIGNTVMARQCSINECYNLIYAGHFRLALKVLDELELEVSSSTDDKVTQRQCQAARSLAHLMKKMAKRLKRYHATEKTHATVDDYQRIRIVD
jgi:hypothetical protein